MNQPTERDPEVLSEVLRRRVLRAMVPVVRKLERAARGHRVFGSDHERHACVALARLAPALMLRPEPEPAHYGPGYHRSHTPEEAARLLARLQASRASKAGAWRDRGDAATDTDNDQRVEES